MLQHHHGGGAALDVWPWRGSSVGVPKGPGRRSLQWRHPVGLHRLGPLRPERRPVSSWASLAPKSAVPAGQMGSPPAPSLSQGVGVDLSGPLRRATHRARSRRKSPGSTPEGMHQDRPATPEGVPLAAACATLKESARRARWRFPKEALEDTPKGIVGADARAASRRTPSFASARSFRRRTASWPDTATFIGRGEEEPEGPKPQAPQCPLSGDPKTTLAPLANQRGRPVVVGVSPRTVRAAARSAHPGGCAAHLSPKRRCSTPGRRRVEPKLVVRRWRPPGAASRVFWEVR